LTLQELESKREAARLRLKEKNEERLRKENEKNSSSVATPVPQRPPAESSDTNQTNTSPIEVDQNNTDAKDQYFIAFARVFSGTLRIGQKVYVLGPKYDPSIYDEDSVRF